MILNWFDILLLALVIVNALVGRQKGLVLQLFSLAGTIVSYLVAVRYSTEFIARLNRLVPVADWFPEMFSSPALPGFSLGDIILRLLGFFLLFAVVNFLFGAAGRMVDAIFHLPVLDWLNSLGGLLAGAAKGFLLALLCVGLAGLIGTPFFDRALQDSLLAAPLLDFFALLYERMLALLLAEFY
ncbi:MAG TPA: CvpA family protein [Firmicutes bacterium]|nr:CvpA family protein [Bacillota bacterium]